MKEKNISIYELFNINTYERKTFQFTKSLTYTPTKEKNISICELKASFIIHQDNPPTQISFMTNDRVDLKHVYVRSYRK